VVATHGLFVGPARERLAPLGLRRLIVTDTLSATELPGIPVRVVSVAPLVADAISRLHTGRSLGDLLVHDSTP